jgi:YD repeat-containing protein
VSEACRNHGLAGRLTRLVNEAGEHTHFQYDAADQLIAETGFDARTQRYEWDAAGQLTASHDCVNDKADALRLSTHYHYNEAGQLTKRQLPSAPWPLTADWRELAQVMQGHSGAWTREEHYSYDDDGQLQSASGMGLQVQFERDALGRTTAETVDASATQGFKHTVRHSYHALGHRQSSQYPHAPEVSWLT